MERERERSVSKGNKAQKYGLRGYPFRKLHPEAPMEPFLNGLSKNTKHKWRWTMKNRKRDLLEQGISGSANSKIG